MSRASAEPVLRRSTFALDAVPNGSRQVPQCETERLCVHQTLQRPPLLSGFCSCTSIRVALYVSIFVCVARSTASSLQGAGSFLKRAGQSLVGMPGANFLTDDVERAVGHQVLVDQGLDDHLPTAPPTEVSCDHRSFDALIHATTKHAGW